MRYVKEITRVLIGADCKVESRGVQVADFDFDFDFPAFLSSPEWSRNY